MVSWTPEGFPKIKVLDFGMAKLINGTFGAVEVLTRKGAVFGTPEYMSPEQAMGQPVDTHADQYALGVMLFEMLAGHRPFSAKTPLDMLQLQIHTPAPVLANEGTNVPEAVSQVVTKMLAKKPAERFADVASAMNALHAAVYPPRASMPERPSAPQPSGDDAQRKWWQVFTGPKK
jgi:serine/threonine protein kinase